jgi:hypothetical protein
MCTFCNKKKLKRYLYYFFLVQYEKRKLTCRTLYLLYSIKYCDFNNRCQTQYK